MYTFETVIPALCAGLVVVAAVAFIAYCGKEIDAEACRGAGGKH